MLVDTQLTDVAANKTGQHPPKKKKHRKNRVRQKKNKEGSDQVLKLNRMQLFQTKRFIF